MVIRGFRTSSDPEEPRSKSASCRFAENVGENVAIMASILTNSAKTAAKPHRASLLAEPFPGTVAQGVSLPKVREMNALIVGRN